MMNRSENNIIYFIQSLFLLFIRTHKYMWWIKLDNKKKEKNMQINSNVYFFLPFFVIVIQNCGNFSLPNSK